MSLDDFRAPTPQIAHEAYERLQHRRDMLAALSPTPDSLYGRQLDALDRALRAYEQSVRPYVTGADHE